MSELILGIIVFLWGLWSITAFFLNKKIQVFMFYQDTYLLKKLLGKHFDSVANLFWGLLWFIIGLVLVFDNF